MSYLSLCVQWIPGIAVEKILIVDDNLANLRYISGQIARLYTVIPAKSGDQALRIAERQSPDLILLDVDMPDMDGFAVLSRLRENDKLRHIPIIFLTANHLPEVEMKALAAGAQDFIAKPFEKRVLAHKIEMHLRLCRCRRGLRDSVKGLEDGITACFAELVGRRSGYADGRARRVGLYMAALGTGVREAGYFVEELTEEELDMMVRAAPLHDIGNIGVSDVTLLKAGSLDEAEYSLVKAHTAIGATILQDMYARLPMQAHLPYAKMIAESHHERYDGSGYPQGLVGDAIPLCARLMAVADVYDALVTDRPYRKALPHEDACRIIVSGKGSAFDPLAIDVFVKKQSLFNACRSELFQVRETPQARRGHL